MKTKLQPILLLLIFMLALISKAEAQQCLSGGCPTLGSQYPSVGAPYTPPSSWQVLNNPATGNNALMNAGNYTRFSVTSGNTYEWSYCESHGGVSTSWDAQMTLFNDANLSTPICFSTDVCGTNGKAPYIGWVATFTGTVRILTTAYTTIGCQTNSGSPYNKMAYRQLSSPPPPNDDCPPPSQYQLTSNTVCNYISGTVLTATASGLSKPFCDAFSGTSNLFDVWYMFNSASTTHSITVVPSTSNGNPVVSVYSSCGGSPINGGCSDAGGLGATESLSLSGLTVGNNYYIRIYDYGSIEPTGSDADFQICVTHTGCSSPSVTASSTNTSCGDNNGSVSAFATGGTPTYSYEWNNGCFSSSCNNLSAGTYTVTVTDANGCTATASATINGSSPGPTPTIIQNGNVLSTAQSYSSYQWSTGAISPSITVSINGIYDVTVTDIYGCSGSASFNFTSIGIKEFSKPDIIRIFPNPNKGSFTISIENIESQKISVKIFSVLGEIIYDLKPEIVLGNYQKEIHLYNVPQGVYFIQTTIGEKTYMNKILKQ